VVFFQAEGNPEGNEGKNGGRGMKSREEKLNEFRNWVNQYRIDNELPPLEDKDIIMCFDILEKFHEKMEKETAK